MCTIKNGTIKPIDKTEIFTDIQTKCIVTVGEIVGRKDELGDCL